eukprot:g19672.t1
MRISHGLATDPNRWEQQCPSLPSIPPLLPRVVVSRPLLTGQCEPPAACEGWSLSGCSQSLTSWSWWARAWPAAACSRSPGPQCLQARVSGTWRGVGAGWCLWDGATRSVRPVPRWAAGQLEDPPCPPDPEAQTLPPPVPPAACLRVAGSPGGWAPGGPRPAERCPSLPRPLGSCCARGATHVPWATTFLTLESRDHLAVTSDTSAKLWSAWAMTPPSSATTSGALATCSVLVTTPLSSVTHLGAVVTRCSLVMPCLALTMTSGALVTHIALAMVCSTLGITPHVLVTRSSLVTTSGTLATHFSLATSGVLVTHFLLVIPYSVSVT